MQSPFFLRNLGLLALAAANLALAVRGVMLTEAFGGPATLTRVLLRTGSFAYAGVSTVLFLLALLFFSKLEMFSESRSQWRVLSQWDAVRPGMTPDEVRARLGAPAGGPQPSVLTPAEDQWLYQLHPLGSSDEGMLAFSRAEPPRVLHKLPTDDVLARIRAEAWPGGFGSWEARDRFRDSCGMLAMAGLLLLALAAFYPRGAGGRWQDWTLHAPVLALVFGLLYEATMRKGWRFDLFFLIPLYAFIAGGWGLRLWFLLKR